MNKDNFYCKCGKSIFIHKYTTFIKDDEFIYKINDKQILCKCKKPMFQKKEFKGVPNYGKFESSSIQQKQEILRKRSKKHFKKEIFDKRKEMSENDKIY